MVLPTVAHQLIFHKVEERQRVPLIATSREVESSSSVNLAEGRASKGLLYTGFIDLVYEGRENEVRRNRVRVLDKKFVGRPVHELHPLDILKSVTEYVVEEQNKSSAWT